MKKGEKPYRFFYHYYKQYNAISVHYKGKCLTAKELDVHVPVESRMNKTQPRFVMQGYCTSLVKRGNKITIR